MVHWSWEKGKARTLPWSSFSSFTAWSSSTTAFTALAVLWAVWRSATSRAVAPHITSQVRQGKDMYRVAMKHDDLLINLDVSLSKRHEGCSTSRAEIRQVLAVILEVYPIDPASKGVGIALRCVHGLEVKYDTADAVVEDNSTRLRVLYSPSIFTGFERALALVPLPTGRLGLVAIIVSSQRGTVKIGLDLNAPDLVVLSAFELAEGFALT
ncbi:hypothetical protein LTR74_018066 [Friedmanniomyces endolithicus]|nr:hypothetical protein LTR74_018066 [Friedmanniomyces endolithicus]